MTSTTPAGAAALTSPTDSLDDAVAQLRSSASFPAEVLHHMPVGTVVQAPSGAIVFGNEAAARILQLSMEQLTGRTSTDPSWRSVHTDGTAFPGEQHPAMQTLQTGAVVVSYMGVRTGDGPTTWIHITSIPVRSGAGELLGAQTFFVDVTTEIEAQHRQRDELDRTDRIAAESSDVVALCDERGVILETIGSSPQVLGRPLAAMTGLHLGDCLDARGPIATAFDESVRQPGGQVRVTVAVPTQHASHRHVEVRLRNRLDDPVLGCIVVTLSDVEERVTAEEELRRVNLDLERRLDELDRTHQLDGLLNQCDNLLAGCRIADEVADVIWDLADQTFPDADVTVRIDGGSGQALDVIRSRRPEEDRVQPDACWAVRTRQVHTDADGGIRCDHRLPDRPSICVPILVEGRSIGSMTVSDDRWPLESLRLTGEKIAARVGTAIPATAVQSRPTEVAESA